MRKTNYPKSVQRLKPLPLLSTIENTVNSIKRLTKSVSSLTGPNHLLFGMRT